MTNAELIKALLICANQTCCDNCPRYDIDHTQDAQRCCIQLINDAANALEAAEKRIAELEAQLPKEGKWIEHRTWGFSYASPLITNYHCSICDHGELHNKYHYCLSCGAKMKGANDGES